MRTQYGVLRLEWEAMSAEGRQMWTTVGRNLVEPNRLGVMRPLSGWQAWVMCRGACFPGTSNMWVAGVQGRRTAAVTYWTTAISAAGEWKAKVAIPTMPYETEKMVAMWFCRPCRTVSIGGARGWHRYPYWLIESVYYNYRPWLEPIVGPLVQGEVLLVGATVIVLPYMPSKFTYTTVVVGA